MAAAAAESDPARSVAMDLDPEAVYFLYWHGWSGMHGSERIWFSEQLNDLSIARSDQSVGGQARWPRPPRFLSRHPGCTAEPGPGREHTGQGAGGDEDLHSEEASALVHCRSVPLELQDRLDRFLPAWEVDIQTYTVGIRGRTGTTWTDGTPTWD
jgi:hypothetical protein